MIITIITTVIFNTILIIVINFIIIIIIIDFGIIIIISCYWNVLCMVIACLYC